ncbi:SprT-like domain-containing protein [Salinicoccus sp. HZC-1]|uniref:SprT family zinc-dependent metalloprotease n=1 Tax=Salinicoccus sp. HZC-1 TaxID=3385497 RepID=UPI00398B9A7E
MDSQTLERCATEFLKKHFDMPLGIPIRISKRMKSRLGAFQIKYRGNEVVKCEIVMSSEFLYQNTEETILDVLYHECVHYALYAEGLPYRDSDAEFITTLDRLGISRTRTYVYKGRSHLYECRRCRYQFSKNIKGYEKRYICGRCRGKFKYVGKMTLGN